MGRMQRWKHVEKEQLGQARSKGRSTVAPSASPFADLLRTAGFSEDERSDRMEYLPTRELARHFGTTTSRP